MADIGYVGLRPAERACDSGECKVIQIVGSVVVVLCVVGGFMLEGGKLLALWHPTEVLIIVGAALGAFFTSNPMKVIKASFSEAIAVVKGPRYGRENYVTLLKFMYRVFGKIRKEGLMAIESDLDAKDGGALFKDYPQLRDDHHLREFITDCLRLMVGGNLNPHELESLLEQELETHHQEAHEPAIAVQKVADALPGFGIVAAVLGIVNTMATLEGADTATIGHKVGAALVGTFLGILMSYGFTAPLAARLEQYMTDEAHYELCIKTGLAAIYKGLPPVVAIEFARRVLPEDLRPTFDETEAFCKTVKAEAAAA